MAANAVPSGFANRVMRPLLVSVPARFKVSAVISRFTSFCRGRARGRMNAHVSLSKFRAFGPGRGMTFPRISEVGEQTTFS